MTGRKRKPVRVAFRPKKVTLELTTKHTHRIFSMEKPRVKFTDLGENPDRILLASMERGWVKAFAYKSNPEKAFLAVGEEVFAVDQWNWAKLVKLVWHLAWFLGVFGKRAKKYKIKYQKPGIPLPYNSDKHGAKRVKRT